MTRRLCVLALALTLVAPACSGGSSDDADAATDSGTDGGIDSDTVCTDTGTGTGTSTDSETSTFVDGGTDTGADAGDDAGIDAGDTDTGNAALLGVYAVTGEDERYGAYTGEAEIRDTGNGIAVIHVQTWSDADFEGDQMALVWQGTLTKASEPYGVAVKLDRVGFMTSYGTETRDTDPDGNAPLEFTAFLARVDGATLTGTFAPASGPDELSFTETWTRIGDPGADPIWKSERVAVPGHDPIDATEKASLFVTYKSYQDLPLVAPYKSRPEFQDAMHYWIEDPTDFEFSRDNPGTVRVIQKVVDTISLAEARIRNRAYSQTLADKEAVFEPDVPEHLVSATGMVCYYDPALPAGSNQAPDGDSMLWTGVYAASQAMRYLETSDAEALDNVVTAIEGQLLCHDIAGTPGDFARTTRVHAADMTGWNAGVGAYAAYDWLPGANNDMMKGYMVGFPWAYAALGKAGGQSALIDRMVAVLDDLLDNNPLLEMLDPPDPTNSISRGTALLVKYMMTGDLGAYAEYQVCYPAISLWMVDLGNGAFYDYGTSDWSGNHLIIQGLLTLYMAADHAAGPLNNLAAHRSAYRDGLAQALSNMRHTRVGLYQLVAATLGNFTTPPPELEEALWTLREFSAPKGSWAMDWTINPSFCMSPFPNLPWKGDWTTSDRYQSLTVYPLFERPPDNYRWKSSAGSFRGGASTWENPGVDYLFAYWFGRHYGVIAAGD
jgi:hypothetical protein